MKRYFALLLTALIFGPASYAQNLNRKKLDSLFNVLQENNLAMGSIAISANGKLIYQKAFGSAVINNTDKIPATENTEYRIGSITKMFTAVIIFQLVEEKKLALNDTLSNYFPELPNARQITISNMLYHRSGLANFTSNTNFDNWKDKPKTHQELLALIKEQKPDFEPNTKADYNNSNYLVLSFIIEKVCKKPYKDVLNERVIKKLGLNQTYYGNDSNPNPKEAASYKYLNNQWKADKAAWLDNFCGAGAIISTPSDMLKFMNALFIGRLLTQNSLNQMKTMIDGYGMGIFPYKFDTHNGFGHNGKTEGFASSLTFYPQDQLTIAYCTNGEVYHKADILDGVLNIYFNKPYTIPTFKPVKLNEEVLNPYIGTYSSGPSGIQVICTKNGDDLQLETRGQKMNLIALKDNKFWSKEFGFFFEFERAGKKMTIEDVEDYYELKKQ